MRWSTLSLCLLALGCGQGTNPEEGRRPVPTQPGVTPVPTAAVVKPEATAADLRTRKTGDDWPWFLGPTRDSVSAEKGILSPWPREGLRTVWTAPVGNGYVMPAISKGRLFLFDHADKKNRLQCLRSETGDFLW